MFKDRDKKTWQPLCELSILKARAVALIAIRKYFEQQGVLEVDVPCLSESTVTDVNVDSLEVLLPNSEKAYLQTSPEYFMKRLLVAHKTSIFYLGKSFRDDEDGRQHRREFTMLEWYRMGWDYHQLMDELMVIFQLLLGATPVKKISYKELWLQQLNVNPHAASVEELKKLSYKNINCDFDSDQKSFWLDLLMTHCVEPAFKDITLVYDYPECQAGLAELKNESGIKVAQRFEAYIGNMEIANGYQELADIEQQKNRFEKDILLRKKQNKNNYSIDQKFMSALEVGLPQCAGVAVGFDRLLMAVLNEDNIEAVNSF